MFFKRANSVEKQLLLTIILNNLGCCHCRKAADLPAKVAKRIGCAHKMGCSLEIGWSPIFVKILGQFLCHLFMQDNFYCLAHGEVT